MNIYYSSSVPKKSAEKYFKNIKLSTIDFELDEAKVVVDEKTVYKNQIFGRYVWCN